MFVSQKRTLKVALCLSLFVVALLLASATNGAGAVSRFAETTTAPQISGLPPPYNKAPDVFVTMGTLPIHLSRSTVRTFVVQMAWQGNGKLTRMYLVKLPPGWTLLRQGTTPYRLVRGQPYWIITNIHGQVSRPVKIHIRLSPKAPTGRAYFIVHQRAQNGKLIQDLTWHGYFWVYK